MGHTIQQGFTQFMAPITVDASGNMSGVGALSQTGTFTLQNGQAAGAMLIGADLNASTVTTATRKIGRINAPPYTNGQPNTMLVGVDNNGTDNVVTFGGFDGSGTPQQATKIDFCTATALNSTTGAARMRIQLGVFHPSATGGDKGNNTLNYGAVYDDNTLLTCMALQEEFIERGEIDLDKWDAVVPNQVVPERRETIEVTYVVTEIRPVAVIEESDGRLVRRIVEQQVEREVPVVWAEPVYDEAGAIVDALETPIFDEVVVPERIIERVHGTARVFKAMIESGFDPRNPDAYFAKMRTDEALPGMPTKHDWQHNDLSSGEMLGRLWLAAEMQAIVANAMWARLLTVERRVAAL